MRIKLSELKKIIREESLKEQKVSERNIVDVLHKSGLNIDKYHIVPWKAYSVLCDDKKQTERVLEILQNAFYDSRPKVSIELSKWDSNAVVVYIETSM
jgi:hypothetical protein